ncbi:WD-40 repeat protein [Richelia sinica FACHB-800]|uniref:WD-40 repeat protein n=1 Tax=Richelia sinica FACHB-800 TaxID=1357546 RepID=A0A975T8B0_9NOST|nr:hypothetical protein [Richelia sinica]MBD2665932.1 hypothetical protein [Richelia sinica FACHB-800]QXE23959.1 WD-40 repeat protein [Richelia sinica FACHB-800]
MTKQEFPTGIVNDNSSALQRLMRSLTLSQGQFTLILVRCNYGHLRERVLQQLQNISEHLHIRFVFLPHHTHSLRHTLVNELFIHHPELAMEKAISAVMVFGLESVIALENVLLQLNQAGDNYAATFPLPIVLWLPDHTLSLLARLAPDFKSWAVTTIKVEMEADDLLSLIREATECLFNQLLAADASKFLETHLVDVDIHCQNRREIEAARTDLWKLYQIKLDADLEGSLEFLLGYDDYLHDQVASAISHYQISLALWKQGSTTDNAGILLKKAIVLFHLGLCYRRLGEIHRRDNHKYWQDALSCFQQGLICVQNSDQQELISQFILPVCEMLYRLKAWQDLEKLVTQSLELNQVTDDVAIAQMYGFLAAVAVANYHWQLASELAHKVIDISETATGVSRQRKSWYFLLLGKTQRYLGEWEEAVNHLEWAKMLCELHYDPILYLEIVEELRSLYFEQLGDYAEAFILKQEKIQIEHQYGFRAFIGASQLQPQRHQIDPSLAAVPPEITASGRQQDINHLINRITRADYKLTVIHGPSGVGKSSLLKAGLIPTLQDKIIGERIPLAIAISIYTDWVVNVAQNLHQVLGEATLAPEQAITPNILIEQIQLAVERKYIVILIFDQFEEFFFHTQCSERRYEFYQFLCQCLNLPFVKIILSLREDYLHCLLELERLSQDKSQSSYNLSVINTNVFDKDIRYYLGYFSKQDAVSVIYQLTKDTHYDINPELIWQLVNDLAGDTELIHPIELQIVGAQLQAENITTQEEYETCGGWEKLVERWLESVIQDCGSENEQITWHLLFALTDEKGRRPIKTTDQLIKELQIHESFTSSVWELIISILVESGLILKWQEEIDYSYQLVHDYLVELIRHKNNYGIIAELAKIKFEKDQAEFAQQLSQEQLNLALTQRLQETRVAGVMMAMMAGIIGALWWQGYGQKYVDFLTNQPNEPTEINAKISAVATQSQNLSAAHQNFDALLASLQAWRQLQQADGVQPATRMQVVTAMQQAVYGVIEVNRISGHNKPVWDVTFSPDGQLLASVSLDRTIKLWSAQGSLQQTLTGHTDAVTSICFSPDGQTLVSTGLDKTVRLWRKNADTGKFNSLPHQTVLTETIGVYKVNFSPDGQLFATGSQDGTIQLWSQEGTLLKTLTGHQGGVNDLAFSPKGDVLASVSDDKTVKIWHRDGTLLTTLTAHQQRVTSVAFSPQGDFLASASDDKTVKLWEWKEKGGEKMVEKTVLNHQSAVASVRFSGDGQKLATSSDGKMNLWNVDGTLLKTWPGHSDRIHNIAFSPDQQLLASASDDQSVKLWSLNPPSTTVLRGHTDHVLSLAWSPDGEILASGSSDRTIKLWQQDTQLSKTLTGHTDKVSSLSFDPKGKLLASGSYDKTIKLWRRDGSFLKTLTGHSGSITSIVFSPDGELLASASQDKTIKLWNRRGQLLKTLEGHQGWVNSLSFSPDGQLLASGSDDQTIKLWQRDGQLFKSFSPHPHWVMAVGFTPQDQLIASASWNNTVKLWRRDGTLVKTWLQGYSDNVNAITFSPNGELLATASRDKSVKIWSREGKLIHTLTGHRLPVLNISFSPNGQTLASASDDNTIMLWNFNLDDLLVRGCSWVNNYLQHNRKVEESDRLLCEGILPPSPPHHPKESSGRKL